MERDASCTGPSYFMLCSLPRNIFLLSARTRKISPKKKTSISLPPYSYSPHPIAPVTTRAIHARRAPKVRAAIASGGGDGSPEQFQENNSISDFMRFKTGGGGACELQTAVVSYRKKLPWSLLHPFLQVDLVSTIHIADKEYFATLQKGLEHYDCVLYEMVASRESLENRRKSMPSRRMKASRSRGFNIIGFIQRQMARILALDFQLDCLDYQDGNWLHADLDFETFKLLQLERGESFFTFARDMTLRSTKAFVQPPSASNDLDPWRSKLLWASRVLPMPLVGLLIIGSVCSASENQKMEYPELEALSILDIGAALKIFLARRLTSEFTQKTNAIEEKSVIIGERNRAATEAMQTAIDSGYKRIAVLYGGGHMPDLGRRLREDFNMVPSQVQWITAWSIRNREPDNDSFPFLKTLAKMSGWSLNRYQTLALFVFSSILALDLWFWELFFGTMVNWASWAASGFNLLNYSIIQDGQKGKKEPVLTQEGLITESLPNGMFRVRLENEDIILGYISGKIRKNFVRILPGDMVKIEVSRYDSTKGRIVYRIGKRN